MIVKGNTSLRRRFKGISSQQQGAMSQRLLQEMNDCAKLEQKVWFSLRDLAGGDKRDWSDTELHPLWEREQNVEQAGKDAGWLLKAVVHADARRFETEVHSRIRQYRYLGD